MNSLPNIQQLIEQNRLEEALQSLTVAIESDALPENAEQLLVTRGKLRWRMQNYSGAVCDFEKALSMNPESEAGPALELARDIFDFYNPDLLNP